MIDDDLGRSGRGTSRPGFERLLVPICEGRVGIVLSLEASRLARNGRDWHVHTVLVAEQAAHEGAELQQRMPHPRASVQSARNP